MIVLRVTTALYLAIGGDRCNVHNRLTMPTVEGDCRTAIKGESTKRVQATTLGDGRSGWNPRSRAHMLRLIAGSDTRVPGRVGARPTRCARNHNDITRTPRLNDPSPSNCRSSRAIEIYTSTGTSLQVPPRQYAAPPSIGSFPPLSSQRAGEPNGWPH